VLSWGIAAGGLKPVIYQHVTGDLPPRLQDPSKKLIYIPNGGQGNVTVVHQDSPDKYTMVATIDTFAGAKTIAVDPKTHNVYLFHAERGPAPAPPGGAPPPAAGGRGRGPQGPILAAWFVVIKQ
jgi:hypothetical protein